MTQIAIPGPDWIPAFLEKLAETSKVGEAIGASGVSDSAVYSQRRRNELFAHAWDEALAGRLSQAVEQARPTGGAFTGWQRPFLEKLAETSNIRQSATLANVPLSTVYAKRAGDRDFALKWEAALYEGYVNLEMEVLGYLRDSDPGYKMDVANALRLLAAHKESAAREKARRSKQNKGEVLARLNAKIDLMRERKAAAKKLLAEDGNGLPVSHGSN